jgi:imidazolonepropionase-like amidohydrolase
MIKRIVLSAIVLFVIQTSFSQTPDTTTQSIVFGGLVKGFIKTWRNADGSFTEWYQYNDRGRGDSLRSTYRVNADGIPESVNTAGVDYMKNPVQEEFSLSNGTASWKNNAENDRAPVSAPAFYIGLKSTVGNMSQALRKNNNRIKLLPYGEATQEEVQTHTIGTSANARRVILLRVTGLGMTPGYNWVDEQYEPFANVSDWFSAIQQGYEANIADLLAIQKKYETAWFNEIAKKHTERPASILVTGVNLFDAVNAVIIPDVDVLVEKGKVKEVSKGKRIVGKADRIIEGRGKTLLPGLWDMHVHLASDVDGILHMASGVTHVRDMGNDSSLLPRSRKMINGELIGPNVEIMSGFIDGAGPLAAPTGALINNVDEGIRYIRDYARKGYQQIKLYSSIKPEWVKPLADEAHKHNMRVAGHIPAFMIAEKAIAAGYDEITHLNMLALNFFGDTIDTRSPNRFRVPAERTAGLDLGGDAVKKFIALLREKKIAVDPTAAVFESLFTARDGKMEDRFSSIVHRFPATFQRAIRAGGGGLPVSPAMDTTYLQSFEAFLKITKLLYDNGITIVPGTDGMAGFDLHHELELYVKAGIPAGKVLQIATHSPAVYIGKSRMYGSVEPGRSADFVIVEGNPAVNISDVRNTKWVMKNGMLYDAGRLYEAISISAK